MSTKVFKYILDFSGNVQKINKDVGGLNGLLKGAAVAAGAMFAVDKVMDAAAAVADYAQEISGVRNEVAQLTGQSGAALDVMTGQVQAIAQAYDAEVGDAIKASDLLMDQFGESAKGAFDIINSGLATSANSNGDFLEQVAEYSPHFKEAGLAASEMVAIIAEGNKMGVFNDKAADAIKEGTIRLREMTNGTKDALNAIGLSSTQIQNDISSGNKSMFEVMQLVSRQLTSLPQQSPAVGQALADIFGGPGEDAVQFIRSLGDLNTSLDDVIAQGGAATAAQMEWADTLSEFHATGAQVFGGTNTMITQVKTTMLGWVNDSMKGLVGIVNYFIDLYNESVVFRGAIEYVKLGFNQMVTYATAGLKLIWENLKSTGKMVKAIFTMDWEGIKSAWVDGFKGMGQVFVDAGKETAENYENAWNNTLNPKKKIELISLSDEDAQAAGQSSGINYAAGFAKGMGMVNINESGGAKSLSEQVDEALAMDDWSMNKDALKGIDDAFQKIGSSLPNDEIAEMAASMNQWTKSDSLSFLQSQFSSLGESIGGTAGNFLGFAANMLEMIPQLIVQVAALTGAEVAGSAAVTSAKGSEAMVSGIAASQKVPFPLNIVALAATVAAVASALSSIPKFATGGIIGGSSFSGDSVLIRANSGEEVLRRNDPRHTLNATSSRQVGGGSQVKVLVPSMRLRKGDIYIAFKEGEKEFQKRNGR
ncbi:minor tail protein [Mangrovibacterium marinum]|uniref:Minor tail protein n=1 Tax=Mangrovibacterium marinum TaxID=1639118 RepID=A0A2T5C0G2_9BACT|nr:phage tail tape measure protein [Mangrovibacterium marinum]PTN08038.1 minor tail protein [Mangrovibacterium marinum]